jgi:thymidine kinase
MGSSKSANLLTSAYNYKQGGKRVLYIKPKLDTRDTTIKSRIGIESKCEVVAHNECLNSALVNLVEEARNKYNEENPIAAIFVDEVQFFSKDQIDEMFKFNTNQSYRKVPIICFGLMTSHVGELFDASKRLIENGAKLKEIKSICINCTKKATHHLRYVDGQLNIHGDAISIEQGNVTYESVCYECYVKAQCGE